MRSDIPRMLICSRVVALVGQFESNSAEISTVGYRLQLRSKRELGRLMAHYSPPSGSRVALAGPYLFAE